MKKLLISLIVLTLFPLTLLAQDYKELWEKVEEAENKRQNQIALNELEPIYKKALKENNQAETIKAICKRVILESLNQSDSSPSKYIKELEKTIKTDNNNTPMLKIILAKWYFHYYTRHRFDFIKNTQSSISTDSNDFTKWNLLQLFSYISNLFDSVIDNEEELSKIPIYAFKDFLTKSNQPEELISNLYEFFLHEALDFYCHEDQATVNPKNVYRIKSDSKIFGNIDEFIDWKPENLDKQSPSYKAIILYQKLLTINKKNNNINALINNNIERIQWAYNNCIDIDKEQKYISSLENLISEFPDNNYISTAYFLLSHYYCKNEDYIKALDYAEKSYQKFPGSYGGSEALKLISEIKNPSLAIETEKVLMPEKGKIKVIYRNLKHIYFRLIKCSEKELFEDYSNKTIRFKPVKKDSDFSFVRSIINKKPDYSFDFALDDTLDYKKHVNYFPIPKVEKGSYLLVSSTAQDYSENNNSLDITPVQISNLALIAKTTNNDNICTLFVVDSDSGVPIENAEVTFLNNKVKTNKDGICKFKYQVTNKKIICNYKDDKVYTEVYNCRKSYLDSSTHTKVYLFTDRAIYRPGQTVYFKAIATEYNTERSIYEVLNNNKIDIKFKDPNNQIINNISLITNEFGSCNGTFVIPTDRLTGDYTIDCNGHRTSIKVEEYKRPKFKVEIEPTSEGYQLNQIVKLKGRAISYTGAAIDNAQVNFRVARVVKYFRRGWWIPPVNEEYIELNQGTVKTDEKGEFFINFKATPEIKKDRKQNPVFTYTITADVTDNSGETRSINKTVSIGYTAMYFVINCLDKFNSDENFEFSIESQTSDGHKIPSTGQIKIYSLVQPAKPERITYNRPDSKELDNEYSSIRNMKEGNIVFEENFKIEKNGEYKKSIKLSEGIYRIKVESKDSFGKEVKFDKDVVAISHSSDRINIKLPFFLEVTNENLKPGDTFEAFWGTGYENGPAYIEIIHKNKTIKSFWTDPQKNKVSITFPISDDMRGGFGLKALQVKENKLYSALKNVNVDWVDKKLNLKLIHFNSKIKPNSKESWKLEVSGKNTKLETIEMLASMYDASLDAFANHVWPSLDMFYKENNIETNSFSNGFITFNNLLNSFDNKKSKSIKIEYPDFPSFIYKPFYNLSPYGYFSSRLYKTVDTIRFLDVEPYTKPVRIMFARQPHNNQNSGKNSTNKNYVINDEIDLSNIDSRSNLKETAFFQPNIYFNKDGIALLDFEMPESLTTWNLQAFAHGTELQNAIITQKVTTQKELMVQPNVPRFLREGEKIDFSVKITNLSDKEQSGSVALDLLDFITEENRNSDFNNKENKKSFTIPSKQSKGFNWTLNIPNNPGFIKYKIVGNTNTHSDGEEAVLPILSSKKLITESLALPIRWAENKSFKFDKLLKSSDSKTLEHKSLIVEMTTNPFWYVIQTLPYLMNYPYECSEQTFNRFYANKLATQIIKSNPIIKKVYEFKDKDGGLKNNSLISKLENNLHLKSITLMETPWVLEANNDNKKKQNICILLDESSLKRETDSAYQKLKNMQLSNGAFSWFPAGAEDVYLTIYIMSGFGRLKKIGIDIDPLIPLKCADYLDKKLAKLYDKIVINIKDGKEDKIYKDISNPTIAFYLYGRSFFLNEKPLPVSTKEAVDFFIEQAKSQILPIPNLISQAHIALALYRFGLKQKAKEIVEKIKDISLANDEEGRFWQENEKGYYWYNSNIETQALIIEMLSEITNDKEAIDDCKVWLLKQKKANHWKSTKATADAIYALLLNGINIKSSIEDIVKISLNNKEVAPDNVEAGTGYYERIFTSDEITPQMGNIQVTKKENGISWGAVHWQYLEDISKITPYASWLKLKKDLYIKKYTDKGLDLIPIKDAVLNVGDLIVIKLEIETDRNLEYIHLKDQHGSGMEPINILSKIKRQGSLLYYESTKDTSTNFFFNSLPKGKYVFEYELRVQHAGEYQSGIAEIMCMYAPEFSSHTQSFILKVTKN